MDALAACSDTEVLRAVTEASAALLNRTAAGEFWGGAGSAAGGRSAALAKFQLVHRLVESKLTSHKRLLGIVASCVSCQVYVLGTLVVTYAIV
jgi:hypothetical protein